MPARSKKQQRFMGMVHATQKGTLKNPSKAVASAATSMSKQDATDYASTSHKDLPERKKAAAVALAGVLFKAAGVKEAQGGFWEAIKPYLPYMAVGGLGGLLSGRGLSGMLGGAALGGLGGYGINKWLLPWWNKRQAAQKAMQQATGAPAAGPIQGPPQGPPALDEKLPPPALDVKGAPPAGPRPADRAMQPQPGGFPDPAAPATLPELQRPLPGAAQAQPGAAQAQPGVLSHADMMARGYTRPDMEAQGKTWAQLQSQPAGAPSTPDAYPLPAGQTWAMRPSPLTNAARKPAWMPMPMWTDAQANVLGPLQKQLDPYMNTAQLPATWQRGLRDDLNRGSFARNSAGFSKRLQSQGIDASMIGKLQKWRAGLQDELRQFGIPHLQGGRQSRGPIGGTVTGQVGMKKGGGFLDQLAQVSAAANPPQVSGPMADAAQTPEGMPSPSVMQRAATQLKKPAVPLKLNMTASPHRAIGVPGRGIGVGSLGK